MPLSGMNFRGLVDFYLPHLGHRNIVRRIAFYENKVPDFLPPASVWSPHFEYDYEIDLEQRSIALHLYIVQHRNSQFTSHTLTNC